MFQFLQTSLHFQSDSSLNSLNIDSATFGNLRQKFPSISSVNCSHNKTQLKLIILMLNHTTFFHEAGDQPLSTLIGLGFAMFGFKWGGDVWDGLVDIFMSGNSTMIKQLQQNYSNTSDFYAPKRGPLQTDQQDYKIHICF